MTVEEAGRKGGERTSETHGREFYQEIGHKGGEKVAEEKGPEFYQEIGKKGGETVAAEKGPEFYSEIGKKGGQIGGPKGGAVRAQQHEGTPEAEGKMSLEEAGRKGGEKVRRLVKEGEEHENE